VLIEQIHQENRKILIRFLRKHLKGRFTPSALARHTGVAKKWVRRLLETSLKVSIHGQGNRYTFQGRPPKGRA
jgi:hypothetical protein